MSPSSDSVSEISDLSSGNFSSDVNDLGLLSGVDFTKNFGSLGPTIK